MLRFQRFAASAIALLFLSLAVAAGMGLAAPAASQTYPSRSVKIVVPFAAGGAVDIVARIAQGSLERALKQSVIVENRPGASGVLGTDAVARAEPDGLTLLVAPGTHTVNAAVNPKMPYDTEKDLAPVILISKNPLLFVINSDVPAKNMSEFVTYARANPDKLNYASAGAASHGHLMIALWSSLAKVQMQHVPYRGGAPAILSTVAGETQFTAISALIAGPHVKSGKLRALAIGRETRDPNFAEVPTLAEAGYPGIEASTWIAMFAPAATPPGIVARLNNEISRSLQEPDVIGKLEQLGSIPAGGTPEALGRLVSSEVKRWTEVARDNKITAQP